jgi:2-C-methyl-D-erythritol 4-phosphate cytidylyltransferase
VTIGVVIAAAGAGARLGAAGPKALLTLAGESLLARCLSTFLAHPAVTAVVTVVPDPAAPEVRGLDGRRVRIVQGGAERQDSVRAGLSVLPEVDVVLVHDAARPFAGPDLIDAVAAAAFLHGAALPALPLSDTLKRVDTEGRVGGTIPREGLFTAQTPQGFRGDLLRRAHEAAARDGIRATDDAALVERMGVAVQIVAGDPLNIKITTPADLLLAEAILVARDVRRA